jgi:hypothetical protein
MKPNKRYMTLAEVADYFRAGKSTIIENRARFGKLRRVKNGRRWLFLTSSVLELARELDSYAAAPAAVSHAKIYNFPPIHRRRA